MISSGIAGRPTGSVRINPRAPYADRLVGAYLFGQASGGWCPDVAGRNSAPMGTATLAPAPFGLGVQTLAGTGVVTPNPPPFVGAFAVGGVIPVANQTGLVIGAGSDEWNMASFNWGCFTSAGAWRFGVGLRGSLGAGTPAPVGRFDVGMSRDPSAVIPTATCYVSGVPVLTDTYNGGTDASRPLRSTVSVQTPSQVILDYLLMFSALLPDWAHAEIRRNPYQYFQTPRRSLWAVGGAAPATDVAINSPVGVGSSLSLTLASPATDVAIASSVGIGAALALAFASPATDVSIASQVGIGSALGITLASPATSVAINSQVGVGSALSVTFAAPATSLAINSQVGIGSSLSVAFASPATSLAINSAVGVGSSLSVAFASPATSLAVNSQVGIGSSLALTFTSSATSVAINSAVGIGSSLSLTLTSPATSLAINSGVGVGSALALSLTSPATTLAIASQVGVGSSLSLATTSPTTTLAIASAVGIGSSLALTSTHPATSIVVASAVGIGAALSVRFAAPASAFGQADFGFVVGADASIGAVPFIAQRRD